MRLTVKRNMKLVCGIPNPGITR